MAYSRGYDAHGGSAPRKPQKRVKRRKKRRPMNPKLRVFLSTVGIIFAIGIICIGVICGYVYNFADNYVNGEKKIDLEMYKANQAQTSIIYAYDSNRDLVELLRLHGAENRVWMEYEDIPRDMIDAFRDLEDKRFMEHQGVDWTRTILGVAKSGFEQGGSTITQQLIKNLTQENGRMASRKFYEILNALNVERYYHKKTIMEFYLNTVYLGNGCYGIKTAAEVYFGKNVEDLNTAECAIIASITQSPAKLDPLTDDGYEQNKIRKEYCLSCMLEQGSITKAEYNKAMDFEPIFTNSENYKGSQVTKDDGIDDTEYTEADVKYTDSGKSSYYVEYVIDQVIEDLQDEYDLTYNEAWRKVFFGGLRIYTAVDLDVQSAAENVYVNRITFPEEEDTEEYPAVQSAITIMDYSGRVVALVGGADEKDPENFRGLNRATQSPRQPGSSIKPLSVYTPAIENNVATWSTMVQNYGIRMGSSRWPVNYGGSAGSPNSFVTVQYALQVSYNTVPAQLMRNMNMSSVLDFLSDDLNFRYLITDEDDPNYDGNYSSLCVGGMSEGVTTLEMASAFAMFGNNGYYYKPYSYYKVTNHDGTEVLLESNDDEGEQVISESTAGVMRQLLRTVVTSGTGGGYGVSGFETFAKTGTTTDDKDRWFVGGTPYYVAAVWYGYDEPRPITNTSGNPAGKIFREIMDDAHENLEYLSFPTASGVVARTYCRLSGDIATAKCQSTATGYYKSSYIPSRCDGCAIVNGIGEGIPDVILPSTSEESTTKRNKKPKHNKTTKPHTTIVNSTTTTEIITTLPPVTETTAAPDTTEVGGTAGDTSTVDALLVNP